MDVIDFGLLFFPILSFLILLPYLLVQYRKYGSISMVRSFLFYSFILYASIAFFMVCLPLPSRAAVAAGAGVQPNWLPFALFRNFSAGSGIVWGDRSTYLHALLSGFTLQYVFNVLLLLPLGIYLRYYFRCSFAKTLAITLCTTLFFELSQFTGLFGLYAKPYRCADVDDLICNTLGGVLGYCMAGPLMRLLPSMDKLIDGTYKRGAHISALRRLLALCADMMILVALFSAVMGLSGATALLRRAFGEYVRFAFAGAFCGLCFLYFTLFTWLMRGQTPGKMLLRFRIATVPRDPAEAPVRAAFGRVALRYGLLYGGAALILGGFSVARYGAMHGYLTLDLYNSAKSAVAALLLLLLVGGTILNRFSFKWDYLWGLLTRTGPQNTVRRPRRRERRENA